MGKSARKKKKRKRLTSRESQTVATQAVLPLAQEVRKDLRELVHTLGMQAIAAMLEEERTELCGPRYVHAKDRLASRGGTAKSRLMMGGRTVSVRRPRVVGADRKEIPLASWEEMSATDPLEDRAYEQMVVGVATRKYDRSLERLPEELSEEERSTSRSTVSRKFVQASRKKLDDWLSRDLSELDLVGVFIDGLHFADHVVLVALGVDTAGAKHVLGLWEGATENSAACRALLTDLDHRGVKANRTRLFVIDGSKALRSAIRDVYGKRALVQRCQVHKVRNVTGHLPKERHPHVRRVMRQAYKSRRIKTAKKQLKNLAESLEIDYPGAAASLLEGLEETLTVIGLGLPKALERSFSTTNPIENFNGRVRQLSKRVKRWRGGSMILRWVAASVGEAEKGFRRLKGCRSMSTLVAALDKHDRGLRRRKKRVDANRMAA